MAAYERQVTWEFGGQCIFRVSYKLGLGAARVGDQAACRCGTGCFGNVLSNQFNGRAYDDQLRLFSALSYACADLRDAAARQGLFKRFAAATDADDRVGKLPL